MDVSLQVLLLAVLLTIWTEIPTESWQDNSFTSHFNPYSYKYTIYYYYQNTCIPPFDTTLFPCQSLMAIHGIVWQDETSFSFVEVFAGQAEVTRMFRFANLPAARLDLLYMDAEPGKQNPMNLLSDAGMGKLGIIWICLIRCFFLKKVVCFHNSPIFV